MTTSEEHNKKLAYSHLGYAAFQLLMMLVMIAFSILIFAGLAAGDGKEEFPVGLVAAIFIISSLFQLLFTVPSIIAGFGLLKRKRWAKTASIIAGVLCAMSFPIGTAVCVYTFWFLFGEHGKALYDRPLAETTGSSDYFLNEPSDEASVTVRTERKREYAPPREMPNWRE